MVNGAKHWCFTSYLDAISYANDACNYMVIGREVCPATGRRHLQGFVSFKTKTTLKKVKEVLGDPAMHLEPKRGSCKQASDYCKKDGDFDEWGELPPEQGEAGGIKRKAQYDQAAVFAREGNFDAIQSDILLHCYSNIKKIREDELLKRVVRPLHPGVNAGTWLQGAPGVGKSFFARFITEFNGYRFYLKPLNKWWDGYEEEEVVIVEDIDHFSAKYMEHFLKIWVDEAPFLAEKKGGTTKIRPRHFIVTSNYTIEELWPNDLLLQEAIKRRFFVPRIIERSDLEGIRWPENSTLLKDAIPPSLSQTSPPSPALPSEEGVYAPSSSQEF